MPGKCFQSKKFKKLNIAGVDVFGCIGVILIIILIIGIYE
jgi:hypothetical protein